MNNQPSKVSKLEGVIGAAVSTLKAPATAVSHEALLVEIIREKLERCVSSIETPYFSDPALQILEFAPAIARIRERAALVALCRDVFAFATHSKERADSVASFLPFLLRDRDLGEKRALVDMALHLPCRSTARRMVHGVLRSAGSRLQLEGIVTPARRPKLLALQYLPVSEIVAKVSVLAALKDIPCVVPMWGECFSKGTPANRKLARLQLCALKDAAHRGLEAIERLELTPVKTSERPSSRRASLAPRPLQDAVTTLQTVSAGAERLLAMSNLPYTQMRDFVNAGSRRLALECGEGIRLLQSRNETSSDLWGPKSVSALLVALRRVPDGHRVITPKLREFIAVKMDSFGERRPSGRVALSSRSTSLHREPRRYDGAALLTWVTIHEVGHSIQMGREGRCYSFDSETQICFPPHDPTFHFKSFMALSGWRIITPTYVQEQVADGAVAIGEAVYPLNRPVQAPLHGPTLQEESKPAQTSWRIFRLYQKALYCHDATAQFGLNKNSTNDPQEDWAEAFTEYILCPDGIIKTAPEKFYYMELHFNVYRAKGDFTRLVAMRKALKHQAQERSRGLELPGV